MNYLDNYYNSYNEDSRLEPRCGQVEFLTTMRYIQKYLHSGVRILEVGAATGRYSHALAGGGYSVDAVELIPRNIEVFKSKITAGEPVTIKQGNAINLPEFKAETYDITLVLGPLYHLYNDMDKQKAISEALRVTKTGGVVFVSYCISDISILQYGFKEGHIFEITESGLLSSDTFKTTSTPKDLFELVRKSDIDNLMSHFNVKRLHYLATDLFVSQMTDVINAMDDATFEIFMKYQFCVCEYTDLVGITNHSLDIFEKI